MESLSCIITDPFPEQLRMLVSPRAADRRSDWHQKSLVSICIYTYLNVRYMLMNNEVDTNPCPECHFLTLRFLHYPPPPNCPPEMLLHSLVAVSAHALSQSCRQHTFSTMLD